MKPIKDLIDELNQTDESTTIEAKIGLAIDKSVLESICAFSNEPGLGGGYILLGVERQEDSLIPSYTVTGTVDDDKLQLDLSSQCASMFSKPVRPEMEVEKIGQRTVLKIFVRELPETQKPVFFKSEKLPKGAFRRIGSSGQRCTEDDLLLFYNSHEFYDASFVNGSDWSDVDEDAVRLYRRLRATVNENADELQYSDQDLLRAMNCIGSENGKIRLTYAGLQVFGSKIAQRRLAPAVRVDYIRVPVREVGAIDNSTYRQINDCEVLKASTELRSLKIQGLLSAKGKGRATYYIADAAVVTQPDSNLQKGGSLQSEMPNGETESVSAPPPSVSAPPQGLSAPSQNIMIELEKIKNGKIAKEVIMSLIIKLCAWKPLKASEISSMINKSEKYMLRVFIAPLREQVYIRYTIPEMVNHPGQAYTVDQHDND